MERRYLPIDELRVETREDGPSLIRGRIPYQSKSLDLGGFVEEIMPGAFARSLREHDQVALWGHDATQPLGRRSRGTLTLDEGKTGLGITIEPPDTSWGRDALISVGRGDVQGISFGFDVPENGDNWREWRGQIIRSLLDVNLFEVSPVVFPAYTDSQIAVRAWGGDIPVIPAGLRGATSSAETSVDLRAQAARNRVLRLRTVKRSP